MSDEGPQLYGAPGQNADERKKNFVVQGPRLNIILLSPDTPDHVRTPQTMVQREALIDTGATSIVIDRRTSRQLKLPAVDSKSISVVGGKVEAIVCSGIIEVPELGFRKMMPIYAVSGTFSAPVLLGRSFLSHFQMTYDGPTGTFSFLPVSYQPVAPWDDE